MMRLRRSRPSASVPRGYAHEPPAKAGGRRERFRRSCARGSCGATKGAATADTMMTASKKADPRIVAGTLPLRRRFGAEATWVVTSTAHSRVQERVGEVDYQVDGYDDHRDAQCRGLD